MGFPEPPPAIPATSIADLDAAIDKLHAKKDAWTKVPIPKRIELLEGCITQIAKVAPEWARVGARLKGFGPDENGAGEEWLAGIVPTVRNARLLAEALRQAGAPKPASLRSDGGRTRARVFPANLLDRVMLPGVTADVWIEKGKPASQGAIYAASSTSDATKEGRVALVLGGGNVSSIPPMDVFYRLFVENEVVLLKMNPVNEAVGPVLAEALAPLVDGGWLAIVYGGAEVGAHAAAHPKIGTLHVTGSDRTYDAIVWGGDEAARAERKASGARVNAKPFSAELGCVTPVIVVPGPWSAADVRFQARHVAAMITQNASFNCNAAKVVVTARGWLQRETFLDALHAELRKLPARKAYYPGAQARYRAFLEQYPKAMVLGAAPTDAPESVVPWTAIPDVPASAGEYAMTHEAFCGVVAEVTLDTARVEDGIVRESAPGGPSVSRFLEEAVRFANERCWGTLSCAVLVHPDTEEANVTAFARAIEDLRYGAIGINVWPGAIYALGSPTWGAYPGHTPEDIQSGTGVVHNAFLFDHPEKTVMKAPFRIFPTPPWFSDHKNLLEVGKRLAAFEAKPSWGGLLRVARAAIGG